MKILNYLFCLIFLTISLTGIIWAVNMIIEAGKPCSSDGCGIRLLYFVGIPILFVSGVLFYLAIKSIIKLRRKQIKIGVFE